LQGASLQEAVIFATQLSEAFIWRTNSGSPPLALGAGLPNAVGLVNARWGPEAPGNNATVPWNEEAYQALKRMMKPIVPPPNTWDNQMLRLSRLDCASSDRILASCDPSANLPAEAKAWQSTLENARVDNSAFAKAWAQGIEEVMCAGEGHGWFFSFTGGRSLRSLGDDSLGNSLFALREMTSISRNQIVPPAPEASALNALAPSVVDLIMSSDCRVSALLTDSDKMRLLRIKQEALKRMGK
jgi:hypothetical protein